MTRQYAPLLVIVTVVAALSLVAATPASALEIVVADAGDEHIVLPDAWGSLWSVGEEGHKALLGRARSDEAGRIRFSQPGGGRLVVVVWADGYVRRDIELPVEPREAIKVGLDRGLAKTLEVRTRQGRPVKEFRVTVLPEDLLSTATTITRIASYGSIRGPATEKIDPLDPDRLVFSLESYGPRTVKDEEGRIVLRGLLPGRHRLLISAPGFGVADGWLNTDQPGPAVFSIDMTGCREVKVVDSQTGQGVEGAFSAPSPLLVEGPYARIWPAWGTGVDGRLTLGCPSRVLGFPADRIVVAKGYAPTVLQPDGDVSPVELGTGSRITGAATDSEGTPLAGRLVIATVAGFERRAEIDGNGEFVITGVPSGIADLQLVDPQEEKWIAGRRLEIEQERSYEVNFTPEDPLRLLIMRNGEPWPDVTVAMVSDSDDGILLLGMAEADDHGRCLLPRPGKDDAGVGLVLVDHSEFLSIPMPKKGLIARLAEKVVGSDEDLVMEVDIEGRFVEGRVIDAETKEGLETREIRAQGSGWCEGLVVNETSPLYIEHLAGFVPLCMGSSAVTGTGDQGHFRLFVPRGVKRLSVQGGRRSPRQDVYETVDRALSDIPSGKPVTISLRKAGSVRVQVVDPSGRVPPGCSVGWTRTEWGPGGNRATRQCDDEGVLLSPPSDVPFLVVAEAAGFAPGVEGPVVVPSGGTDSVRIMLQRGGTIRVLVGEPRRIRGRVYVPPGTISDAAGRDWTAIVPPDISPGFTEMIFSPLPPGRWSVRLGDEHEDVRLESDEEVVVDFSK